MPQALVEVVQENPGCQGTIDWGKLARRVDGVDGKISADQDENRGWIRPAGEGF
jgi:hypothetical protein